MMMNRNRLSFWVRLVSIVLAAFFLLSFIFLGLGTNISYNLFEQIRKSRSRKPRRPWRRTPKTPRR
jgi:hypothetical protein